MSFLVIGYYTKDTDYEQEIQGLVKSCANFDIPCEIRGYESRESWQENTCIKPEFILDMMEEYPDKDLVYIDADAIVQKYPVLFDTMEADLAIHYKDGTELLSGTIFIRNSERMKLFIKCWANVLGNHEGMIDQHGLNMAIQKYADKQGVFIARLPATYTQIFDLMQDAGEPVIEHFQASRRFKQSIKVKRSVPESVMGFRTRESSDGSFYLVRATPKVIAHLDKKYSRVGNELRWLPKSAGDRELEELSRYFEDKECYIVGKGPSLDWLKASDFKNPNAPVICINESIHKVESLGIPNKVFVMQQDTWLKDTCRPKYGSLLITISCKYHYADVKDKYVFHYAHLGLMHNNLTVVYALAITKMFKGTGYKLLCFDACIDHSIEYGKCIGHDSDTGGSPERFLGHKRIILGQATPLPIEFVTPEGHRK